MDIEERFKVYPPPEEKNEKIEILKSQMEEIAKMLVAAKACPSCATLCAEVDRLREENRRLMQSNLELLDEQKTTGRDLRLWTDYGHKRGIDVVDLFPRRGCGTGGEGLGR